MSPMSFQVESVAVPRSELVKVLRLQLLKLLTVEMFLKHGRCRMALKT